MSATGTPKSCKPCPALFSDFVNGHIRSLTSNLVTHAFVRFSVSSTLGNSCLCLSMSSCCCILLLAALLFTVTMKRITGMLVSDDCVSISACSSTLDTLESSSDIAYSVYQFNISHKFCATAVVVSGSAKYQMLFCCCSIG